jgi:hypothetical protein
MEAQGDVPGQVNILKGQSAFDDASLKKTALNAVILRSKISE